MGGEGRLEANEALLRQLGQRDPDSLVKLFDEHVGRLEFAYPLFSALAASEAPAETKARLFLAAAKHSNNRVREFAIGALLDAKHPQAADLLINELRLVPRTPIVAYWMTNTASLARLVCQSDDPRVWDMLRETAKRVDLGQRLQILDGMRYVKGPQRTRAIDFLVHFLDDKEVRPGRDLEKLATQAKEAKDAKEILDTVMGDLFFGPSAGFQFDRLVVGDYAAYQLARLLELDVDPEPDWKPADWAKLQGLVRKALAERKESAKSRPPKTNGN